MMRNWMIAVAACLPLVAVASDMPRFDVEAQCQEVASFGGDFSNTTYNGCIQMEQSAYNRMKADWTSIPDGIRRQCTGIAAFGGAGSYSTLGGCVDMETEAASNRQSFSFD